MKSLVLVILVSFSFSIVRAQKYYFTSESEFIFGFSNAAYKNYDGIEGQTKIVNGPMRFTMWLHQTVAFHANFHKYFGVYTGLGVKNIGFITNEPSTYSAIDYDVKWKRRVYTLGIPLAIKIGKVGKGSYLILGGEYQWLFHYKEKEFANGEKRKYTDWMSDRVNQFLPTAIIGFGYKDAFNINFNYALDNMMNPDFNYQSNGATIYPYKDMESVIFYISIISKTKLKNYFKKEKQTVDIAIL